MQLRAFAVALALLPAAARAQAIAPPGASSCSGCHALRPGTDAAISSLGGRPASEIADAMAAYRAGERPATIMTRIARGFSADESRAIAEWLERQR